MGRTAPGRTRERVYRFVRDRLAEGSPPTIREVQRAMGFGAVESARRQLEALVAEGRLRKTPGRARGYRLAGDPAIPLARVPLLGEIRAGGLDEAIESAEGFVAAAGRGAADLFALRVRGESMRDAGIRSGDVCLVRRQPSASSGDIVVALVGDEATIKTFRRRGRRPVLEPANPEFEPIRPVPGELRILGKVVEVRRRVG